MLKFREYLNSQFIIESMDTTHEIIKVEKGNPDFYYINIDTNIFRIFIEKSEDSNLDLHIGFEYLHPSKGWLISGIQDILSAKNVLGIFGTIYNILKLYNFNSIMFCSNEPKKFRTYLRLMDKLSKELNIKNTSHNDMCIFLFKQDEKPGFKCKYKCKANKINEMENKMLKFRDFLEEINEARASVANWKDIANKFDSISKVELDKSGLKVIVTGKCSGKEETETFEYTQKPAAKGVAEKLKMIINESAVGKPGRTTLADAEDHIDDALIADFKKIVKKLGGKTVAKALIDKLGTKAEVKDEIEDLEKMSESKTPEKVADDIMKRCKSFRRDSEVGYLLDDADIIQGIKDATKWSWDESEKYFKDNYKKI